MRMIVISVLITMMMTMVLDVDDCPLFVGDDDVVYADAGVDADAADDCDNDSLVSMMMVMMMTLTLMMIMLFFQQFVNGDDDDDYDDDDDGDDDEFHRCFNDVADVAAAG